MATNPHGSPALSGAVDVLREERRRLHQRIRFFRRSGVGIGARVAQPALGRLRGLRYGCNLAAERTFSTFDR